MRIIVTECSARYSGRLNASLPTARRVILVKADQSCLIFSELGSYKPLNWMVAPCTLREFGPDSPRFASACLDMEIGYADDLVHEEEDEDDNEDKNENNNNDENGINEGIENPDNDDAGIGAASTMEDEAETNETDETDGLDKADESDETEETDKSQETGTMSADLNQVPQEFIHVSADKGPDTLLIALWRIFSDQEFDLGQDPGLTKDGVEDHLQRFLAEQIERIGPGSRLVRREFPTPIGPVDIMAVDAEGVHVAIEIKRHGGIDGVEQLTRYVELLNRDSTLTPVRGIFAAQTITPQARTLAEDRGFECLVLDYEDMKEQDSDEIMLF